MIPSVSDRKTIQTTQKHVYQITDETIKDNIVWTTEHENILKEWKIRCFINLWLQENSSYFYSSLNNFLTYPIIVLSTITATLLFASDSIFLKYTVGTLNLLIGILMSLSLQIRPDEMLHQYQIIVQKYYTLLREIDTCLSLTKDMRQNPALMLEKVGVEMDTLMDIQLDPPFRIVRKFENLYGTLDTLLYGEDVLNMMHNDQKTDNVVHRLRNMQVSEMNMANSFRKRSIRKSISAMEVLARRSFFEINNSPSVSTQDDNKRVAFSSELYSQTVAPSKTFNRNINKARENDDIIINVSNTNEEQETFNDPLRSPSQQIKQVTQETDIP